MMVSGQCLHESFSPCCYQLLPTITEARRKNEEEEGYGMTSVLRRRCYSRPAVSPAVVYDSSAPRPGRWKSNDPRLDLNRSTARICSTLGTVVQLLIISLFFFSSGVQAVDPRQIAQRSGLLVDLSPPPSTPNRQMEARAPADPTSTPSLTTILPPSTVSPSSTSAATLATGTAAPTVQTTSLPQVFDTNLGDNFTNTACPKFFTSLQNNANFQACYPLSLLLTVGLPLREEAGPS